MTQAELDRAVDEATGETLQTITRRGFSLVSLSVAEREPLMVDWDELDTQRVGLFE